MTALVVWRIASGAAESEMQVGILSAFGMAYLACQIAALRWAAGLSWFNPLALFQIALGVFHLSGPVLALAVAPFLALPIVILMLVRLVQFASAPLSYSELYVRSVGILDLVFVNFGMLGVMYLLVALTRRGRSVAVPVAALALIAALLGFVGWRGMSAALFLVGLWLIECVARRALPRFLLIGGCVTLLGLFPLVRELRKVPAEDRLSAVSEVTATDDTRRSDSLLEMAETLRTVCHTIELIPSEKAYAYGVSYLWALARAFPNVLGGQHPAAIEDRSPAQWLVWRVSPAQAQQGGGMGYSIVAETYYNFGWPGPPLVLLPLGFLMGALVQWERDSRLAVVGVVVAAVFFALVLGVRNDASMLFRTAVWSGLLPLLAFRVMGARGSATVRWSRRTVTRDAGRRRGGKQQQ